jgi:CRP/FNR family transcriptional regulator, cyclic AMP receptor protein
MSRIGSGRIGWSRMVTASTGPAAVAWHDQRGARLLQPQARLRPMVGHGRRTLEEAPRQSRPPVDVLTSIPLFRVLNQESISAAARAGLSRTYAPGQIICHQGDPGDHLYAVIDGLVKIVFTSERGDEMVLNTMGGGEIFGELALLDGSPRSASVVALKSTSVFVLPRGQLLELMSYNPGLADEFLKLIGRRIRKLTEQAGDLAYLDLSGRLAKLLLQLSEKQGDVHAVVLDHGLTQSDLAGMIGASRPAVNRALQSFATRGLIAVKGRTIMLRDLEALRRRSLI